MQASKATQATQATQTAQTTRSGSLETSFTLFYLILLLFLSLLTNTCSLAKAWIRLICLIGDEQMARGGRVSNAKHSSLGGSEISVEENLRKLGGLVWLEIA